ncbi:MAG: methyltransferase domain-containing protein, partial [Firmicutes bacterium]|nr:methyltransferase domain-containing protein [Bacillota bacterium]
MASYEKFAEVYDTFMQDIPYDKWAEHLKKIWKKYGLEPELVAELGCGTGNMTIRLAKEGYDMIGIDLSEQMLDKAREKTQAEGFDILYLNQDMTEFELYGTVQSIICLCDSINYITERDELLEVFRLVNNYLDPKGLFIFDINTVYKFREILANNSFCETTENSAYTWE